MDKVDYKAKASMIYKRMDKLREELHLLKEEYVNSNAEFTPGEKVLIRIYPEDGFGFSGSNIVRIITEAGFRYAFFNRYSINQSGDIIALFSDDENGKMSRYGTFILDNEKVEKIN